MQTTYPRVSSARWALDIVRNLRAGESTERSMSLVTDLAPRATGCAAAELIESKPKPKSGAESAPTTPVLSLAAECLATGSSLSSVGAEADPAWDEILAAAKPTEKDLDRNEAVVRLSCYLPNGAGRRPAALILSFDAESAPEPDTFERVQAYSELADEAIGYRYAGEQVASLRAALETNREIGTAMGILMATRRVSDDEAFELMRTESQRSRRKLGAVAAEVVYAGTLPR